MENKTKVAASQEAKVGELKVKGIEATIYVTNSYTHKVEAVYRSEEKTDKISKAVREIITSVNTLKNAGRYPRKGWRYEVADMMNDAKLVNSVDSLNAIKDVYCSWCKKCNHGLCLDRAPVSCRLARTYEHKLGVLQDCEYGAKNSGKAVVRKKRKKYERDRLHTLYKNASTWFTQNQDAIDEAGREDAVFILTCKDAFEHRNFGVLKATLVKYGYFKKGRKKVTQFSKIANMLCEIIKEVF